MLWQPQSSVTDRTVRRYGGLKAAVKGPSESGALLLYRGRVHRTSGCDMDLRFRQMYSIGKQVKVEVKGGQRSHKQQLNVAIREDDIPWNSDQQRRFVSCRNQVITLSFPVVDINVR
nr:uncharacterized protein LOC117220561 isoform X2 [Megalopta genalis]